MVSKLPKRGVKVALFWEKYRDNTVKCNLCHRRCIILENRYGACGVRKNVDGTLYTLVYGMLTAANVDPIEKKPLMHFEPGSSVFSISTVGCNFFCKFCLNWNISQLRRDEIYGEQMTPEEVVNHAKRLGADGISYTYNEPTIFYEFMYDTAKLAKSNNLFNTMVTNGYMTPEAIDYIGKYIDAATVDFKGGGNKDFYRKFMGVPNPEPIFESILAMKDNGWWIEITNLVVPIYGDKGEDIRRIAKWIIENLGPETPFHLLRFHPEYMMLDVPPTPISTLEKLTSIAEEEGLKHVYIGNVPGHPKEHTYCPQCGSKVIEREGFFIRSWKLTKDNRCPNCGYKLNIRGKYHAKPFRWFTIFY